jgi:glycosyltransferase involved in cell wall biosynthesis
MPRVSVVIPTFNQSTYVRRAIQSVLGQSLADFELIVVDDGSEDDTEVVVSRYADARVHYVWQPNAGLSAARNRGIAGATGQYVAFLDADDWWHPELLSTLTSALDLAPAEASVAHCDWCYSDASGTRLTPQSAAMTYGAELCTLVLRNPIAVHSALIRRSTLESIGGFSDMNLLEDWDLWLRVAQAGGRFVHVPRVLANYHWHSGSLSKDAARHVTRRLAALDAAWAREPLRSPLHAIEARSYAMAHVDACASWLALDNIDAAADGYGAALARDPVTALSLDTFYRLAHAQLSAFEGGQDGFESRMDAEVAGARIFALLERVQLRTQADPSLRNALKRSANFGLALASYNQGDLHLARDFFRRGFLIDSRRLPERDMLLVFVKSFVPVRALNALRTMKTHLQPHSGSGHPGAPVSDVAVPADISGTLR